MAALAADGPRSHLFYVGDVGNHDFRNFELEVEAKTQPGANSGVYFHTQYQPSGWPDKGYEVQINNSHRGSGNYRELKRTGSLYAVRNIYKSCADDNQWFRVRMMVVGTRIRVWVNDHLTVDYLQPENPPRKAEMAQRLLGHGTIALQGHDAASTVSFRSVRIRLLPDNADPASDPRASDEGYGLQPGTMDKFASDYLPCIDYHIHLRGGMTPQKAIDRQAVTGLNCGVLRNIGQGWPIETDAQLQAFLDSVEGLPIFVGLQVNDRDWMDRHSSDLIQRLDFVLADTMIMPMPDDDGEPAKLWLADTYSIGDPEAWMVRDMKHNLRVLSEPITILANPTYLPPALEDKYDQLWTDTRMRQVIQAAIDNHVALEINASSQWPHDRFIRMAKEMGAKFSFGSNNFNDAPINMACAASKRWGSTDWSRMTCTCLPSGRNPKVEMTESKNMIRLQLALPLLLALTALLADWNRTILAAAPRNVLFILTEDQGAQLSFNGTPGIQTPHMDSIVAQRRLLPECLRGVPG